MKGLGYYLQGKDDYAFMCRLLRIWQNWKKKLKNAALCIPAWLKGAIIDVKL